ncbi:MULTISPECIES: CHASE2 domain-containing protein [unclassified Rhizobium]|uniref:CHASE2 domain-containing protein n=1 Tax=unclassified Rhizobium TaxID=2613769 RepID=UPI0021684004|nr:MULTISPECIES: adenylate/guanylate cyclase domain-containing protein [unclassified Rhizobium]MCS3742623.1 adenylate cyclase [Rhizobium sp. BK661]MCS4094589.1 adenylate cyclase [Rhizobium sp. BK176]
MQARRLLITIALLLSALWGGLLGYMHLSGSMSFLDRLEASLTDLRSTLIGAREAPPITSIVAIDDLTAADNGYPLSRATLARVVSAVSALKPKVIALDLLLVDPGPEEGDAALALALQQTPSVIAAAGVFPKDTQTVGHDANDPLAAIPTANQMLLPLARFSDVAAIGVVNVATDESGTPRFIPLISRGGERVDASFPLRVASLALGINPAFAPGGLALGDRHLPTDNGQRLPITFYGPRGTLPTFSAADALAGKLPAKAIEDRIVVIGATVTGGGDVFPTPFDPVLPGVEVMATAATHLIAGDGIIRDRNVRLLDSLIAVALPLLLISLLAWRRSAIGYAIIACVAFAWAALNIAAFAHGYWFSAALPIAAALPPVLLFGAAEIWIDRRQAAHFAAQSDLLQRIEAPGLGEWLARDPNFLAEPVRQDAAVVFIDLSGFTGLSEAIGVTNVREVLSDFFEMVDGEARSHGGAVTSFMGDGAMILFGLPQPASDDATRAAACAVSLCDRMRPWLAAHPALSGRKAGFKVGAHCGPVVASRLGSGNRQQITATGDTVNVASRLMEVAASRGVELALSTALMKAAAADSAPLRSGRLEGPVQARIRGRSEGIDVWLWQGHLL